jgi:Flp pilus assembly pilin Flp
MSASTAKQGGAATPHVWRKSGVVVAPSSTDEQGSTTSGEARREVNPLPNLFARSAATGLGKRDEGQTMAEYGVALAVITLAVITAITMLSGNVLNAISSVSNILPGN